MKTKLFIALLLVSYCLGLKAQDNNVLNQKVDLVYSDVEIGEVIRDLTQKYQINFSYVSDRLPLHQKVNVDQKGILLKDGLEMLLEETDISYKVIKNQVILQKSKEPEPEEPVEEKIIPAVIPSQPQETSIAKKNTEVVSVKEVETPENIGLKMSTATVVAGTGNTMNKVPQKTGNIPSGAKKEKKEKPEKKKTSKPLFNFKPNHDLDSVPAHFGLFYPVSTNGKRAPKVFNDISLNLLYGVSAGVGSFELNGLGSVTNGNIKGFQASGIASFGTGNVKGFQAAGLINSVNGSLNGFQAAGFMNVAQDSGKATQAAGFMNINNGTQWGMQAAGFMNIGLDSLTGAQIAGFLNIRHGDVYGAQVAGFMNIAANNRGVQIAGFYNKTRDIKGSQIGVLNMARNISGVQIGVFNFADTIGGVPIGLLSIVKKGGYRKFEISGTETLNANIAYKIGVPRFYNIFSVGAQFNSNTLRQAAGAGFGTEFPIASSSFAMNLDLMGHLFFKDAFSDFEEGIQFYNAKLQFSKYITPKTAIFLGASYNVLVSDNKEENRAEVANDIAPWSFYDEDHSHHNVKMWIGLNGGIRF
ncbi:STN domain-containing protein [Flexithrix dorotheae]|uniref:STN domain-containing protein n=1 Tax=Flexithrix dorotheae TaxID=70993 RepID=UPI000368DF0E|nr:STN domain-containing protein [Flexithrix dorotheae]